MREEAKRFERLGRQLVRRYGTRAEIREMNQRIAESNFAGHDSTPEERRMARGMWESGYTLRQIAGKLGRSKGAVWCWSKKWRKQPQPSELHQVGAGPLAMWDAAA
jgi:hypothetical protein